MPRYRDERKNRNNKVTIEYPAMGVLLPTNFRTGSRCLITIDTNWPVEITRRRKLGARLSSQTLFQSSSPDVPNGAGGTTPQTPVGSYAQVASSVAQQQQQQEHQQSLSDRVP